MRKLLAFLAVVAVTACDSRIGGSFVAPQTPTIVGSFKLQSFNGKAPPTVINAGATDTTTVVGDTLTFGSDKSLRRVLVTVTTPPANAQQIAGVASGTYTLTSGALSLTFQNGTGLVTFLATLNGSLVTVNDNNDIWVYQKF